MSDSRGQNRSENWWASRPLKDRSKTWWLANLGLIVAVTGFWNGLIFLSGADDALSDIDLRLFVIVMFVPQMAMLYALGPPIERFVDDRAERKDGHDDHRVRREGPGPPS